MSCNAEEASCMEIDISSLVVVGSIPGTEQDSLERRDGMFEISPIISAILIYQYVL